MNKHRIRKWFINQVLHLLGIKKRPKFVNKPSVWIGILTASGTTVFMYNVSNIRYRFSHLVPHGVLDLEKKGPSYIYIDNPFPGVDEVSREAVLVSDAPTSSNWRYFKIDLPFVWFPQRDSASNYWHLLQKAKSGKHLKERQDAITKLANLKGLHDSDYLHIAQASDLKTAVGLARTHNAKLNVFLKPPQKPESKEPELEKKFRNIIASLPKHGVAHCVAYLTKHVMERGHFYHTTDSGDWYFGSESEIRDRRFKRVAADTMRMFYLDALLSHSTVPSHRRLIIEKGGLQLLMSVAFIAPHVEVCSLVGQIVGNLALDDSLHTHIYEAGWIKLLATWMRDENIEVSVPAARALANLDRDVLAKEFFDDGVYILHPLYRKPPRESITADIVFVHGLTGGAFKTWRQRDESQLPNHIEGPDPDSTPVLEKRRDKQLVMEDMTMISKRHHFPGQGEKEKKLGSWFRNLRSTTYVPSHSACWPKDWLPIDCPHVRIISVDFDAEVSEWFRKCPGEAEKSTIAMRSFDLLQRLLKAGIGQRPIIWVSHSLGGLLVKKLLVTCSQSNDETMAKIWRDTKGIIFFSVPHRGSEWANWGSTERLIMLTQEVQELKYNSSQLIELHEQFKNIVESVHLPCLSFAETLKTNLGLKVEALFVSPYSADPGFGEFITVATDHVNVCKPINRRSKLYLTVLEFIYENIPHSFFEALMAPAIGRYDEEAIMEQYMW